MPTSPLKSSGKFNTYAHKVANHSKKYAMNKTSIGGSYFKSEIPSYISTPNDASLSHTKLKKFGSSRKVTCKTKEIFHSTENENMF